MRYVIPSLLLSLLFTATSHAETTYEVALRNRDYVALAEYLHSIHGPEMYHVQELLRTTAPYSQALIEKLAEMHLRFDKGDVWYTLEPVRILFTIITADSEVRSQSRQAAWDYTRTANELKSQTSAKVKKAIMEGLIIFTEHGLEDDQTEQQIEALVHALLPLALLEKDAEVRALEIDFMGHHRRDKEFVDALVTLLHTEPDPGVRATTIKVLHRIGDPSSFSTIRRLRFSDPNPLVRSEAARALFYIRGGRYIRCYEDDAASTLAFLMSLGAICGQADAYPAEIETHPIIQEENEINIRMRASLKPERLGLGVPVQFFKNRLLNARDWTLDRAASLCIRNLLHARAWATGWTK